eukprot:1719822-Rhodomonas_salina.1
MGRLSSDGAHDALSSSFVSLIKTIIDETIMVMPHDADVDDDHDQQLSVSRVISVSGFAARSCSQNSSKTSPNNTAARANRRQRSQRRSSGRTTRLHGRSSNTKPSGITHGTTTIPRAYQLRPRQSPSDPLLGFVSDAQLRLCTQLLCIFALLRGDLPCCLVRILPAACN